MKKLVSFMLFSVLLTPISTGFAQSQIADSSSVAQSRSIAGTVHAPTGKDVHGITVIACYTNKEGCDDQRSGFVEITQSGESAPFAIANLSDGKYLLIAWQDSNSNGSMEETDAIAIYSQDGAKATLISPPAQDITLQFPRAEQPAIP